MALDVLHWNFVPAADRPYQLDEGVDLPVAERFDAVAVVHELYTDRALVVVQRMVGLALLRGARQHPARAVDHIVDAEKRVRVEEALPAGRIAGRARIDHASALALRAAYGMDDDRMHMRARLARGVGDGRDCSADGKAADRGEEGNAPRRHLP